MEYNDQPDRALMNLLFNSGTQKHTNTHTWQNNDGKWRTAVVK